MNRIELTWTPKGWTAEYHGTERDSIISIMGTAIIPTAYTEQAPGRLVQAEIERLNPGYTVEIGN